VTLTDEERDDLQALIQKGRKGYRIKHAQILLKLDQIPENKEWTYDLIRSAYRTTPATIAGVAKRFVFEGVESALGRKKQENYHRKVTGDTRSKNLCHRLLKPAGRQVPLDLTEVSVRTKSVRTARTDADEVIQLKLVE